MKPTSFIKNGDNENKQKNPNLEDETIYKVQCFPLYSILLAVGRTEIDFLELDVEGSEYKILKTIPWHKVDIKVILTIFLLHLRLHFIITSMHLQKSEFG
jgi:FkbM family methyltransferase